MFKKLVSNLPFSPTTIDQVAFYVQRLKQEKSIRRLGLVLIVFSMCIQLFAAMVPPEKSLAASDNDVIPGGVTSLTELKTAYDSKTDVKALYDHFGLIGSSFTSSTVQDTTFDFQQHRADGSQIVGRVNLDSTDDIYVGKLGDTNFYSRGVGDTPGSAAAYYFDKRKGTDNTFYYLWVLKDSGNLIYQPADGQTPVTACTTDANCPVPTRSKTAQNLTQKLDPATTLLTKAMPNDVIEYTLTTRNEEAADKKGYVIEDYIGDLLDYADVDLAFLSQQGGTYSAATKKVSWANQTLPTHSELKKTFRVTLKASIPGTNQPNATSTNYDCKMQNGYGTETVIPVACPTLKTIDELPNTGPGTAIGVGFAVSVISGYFFMRSQLLAKELRIIKRRHQSGH